MKPIKKELVVTGQSVAFSQTPQTDAEGQQAVRRFHTQVGAGGGANLEAAMSSGNLGQIPGVVEYATTAGEMAMGARTACAGCKHWDQRAWHKFLSLSTGPASRAEDRQTIIGMQQRIVDAGLGVLTETGELDMPATLGRFGICRPLSDIIEGWVGRNPIHWPTVTWREASCPSYVGAEGHRLDIVTPAEPYGLFKPIDIDAEKIGAQRYDQVLNQASGK